MEAGRVVGTTFPATKADTAAGREEGKELPPNILTAEEGADEIDEYPVPILGVKEGVVMVVVDKDTDKEIGTPRSKRFSDCNLNCVIVRFSLASWYNSANLLLSSLSPCSC